MRYFLVSDIHSFYYELKKSLDKAGFDKRNKEHVLVVLGDVFDRGPETLNVYKFIMSVPKSRRILVRGNHELLYFNLLNKDYPSSYDFSNGTVNTFCSIAQMPTSLLDYDTYDYDEEAYLKGSKKAWKEIIKKVKEHPITAWLKSSEWREYYELDKYICVHSFIPIDVEDWREATPAQWASATWGSPWQQYQQGLFEYEQDKGKTLVCGHWHTADFFRNLKGIHTYDYDVAPIYYSHGIIGIDGGCMYNYYTESYYHPQNVLVIDNEDFNTCHDESGNKLEEPFF